MVGQPIEVPEHVLWEVLHEGPRYAAQALGEGVDLLVGEPFGQRPGQIIERVGLSAIGSQRQPHAAPVPDVGVEGGQLL